MNKVYPIHQNARVAVEVDGGMPGIILQVREDDEWVDEWLQIQEGTPEDAAREGRALVYALRKVVAAAPAPQASAPEAFSDPFGADLLRTWKGAMRDAQPAQAGHMGAVAEILRDDRKGAA